MCGGNPGTYGEQKPGLKVRGLSFLRNMLAPNSQSPPRRPALAKIAELPLSSQDARRHQPHGCVRQRLPWKWRSPERPPPVGSLFATRNREDFPRMMKENVAQVISAVNRLSSELDKTPAQLALAWVLSHPEITVAITGADTIEHLNNNVGAIGWKLDDNVRDQLDSVSETFVQGPKGSV